MKKFKLLIIGICIMTLIVPSPLVLATEEPTITIEMSEEDNADKVTEEPVVEQEEPELPQETNTAVRTTDSDEPKMTEFTSATNMTYTSIKLAWKRVKGVTGYNIYRSTSEDGTYKRVGRVTKDSILSYTDKGLTCGTEYYYKISTYKKVDGEYFYSTRSEALYIKCAPRMTRLTDATRPSYTSLTLTWAKISGVSGYALYRSDSVDGTYERVARVARDSSVNYTDEDLTCGNTYFYKVSTYRKLDGKYYYSTQSEALEARCRPNRASISSKSKYTANDVALVWGAVAGAHGYEVVRSETQNGEYQLIATIENPSTLTYTDTGLTQGIKYYYKVRAYHTVEEENVYGNYSPVFYKRPGGWRYENGYKFYYDDSGKLVKDVRNIIGKQSNYVIRINKKRNTVTVYAKDGSNGYIIPVVAFVCSTGEATPIGTFYTPRKYRWRELMGEVYGQWCTRITGSILFHSVYYNKKNNNKALCVSPYNKLGTTASHGCVRLTAGDAKWIYDNCSLRTKVIIYNSSTSGPLGKPTAFKLDKKHRWDPTDPNMKYKCKELGCHWTE